jgi:hypothetical protein
MTALACAGENAKANRTDVEMRPNAMPRAPSISSEKETDNQKYEESGVDSDSVQRMIEVDC